MTKVLQRAGRIAASQYARHGRLCSLGLAVVVLGLDFLTGRHIQFPVLYIAPTAMAAWQGRRVDAYLMAVCLPAARVGFHMPWHETGTMGVALVNGALRAGVLALYTFLIGRVANQSRALRKRVGQLEGILPICASCKCIRRQDGVYEQVETYITRNTQASFSHGICPECARRLYPEYLSVDGT